MRTANYIFGLLLLCVLPNAMAGETSNLLNTAWEAFWQQTGFPRAAYKWQTPIVVKFGGDDVGRHKEFALKQLRTAAEQAGVSVTEAEGDGANANVQVEFFGPNNPNTLPPNEP